MLGIIGLIAVRPDKAGIFYAGWKSGDVYVIDIGPICGLCKRRIRSPRLQTMTCTACTGMVMHRLAGYYYDKCKEQQYERDAIHVNAPSTGMSLTVSKTICPTMTNATIMIRKAGRANGPAMTAMLKMNRRIP